MNKIDAIVGALGCGISVERPRPMSELPNRKRSKTQKKKRNAKKKTKRRNRK